MTTRRPDLPSTWLERQPLRERRRFSVALAISAAVHGLLLLVQFGIPGLGLPGLGLPERRARSTDLVVRLTEAPPPAESAPPALALRAPVIPQEGTSVQLMPRSRTLSPPPALRKPAQRLPKAAPPPARKAQPDILALPESKPDTFTVPPPGTAEQPPPVPPSEDEAARQQAAIEAARQREAAEAALRAQEQLQAEREARAARELAEQELEKQDQEARAARIAEEQALALQRRKEEEEKRAQENARQALALQRQQEEQKKLEEEKARQQALALERQREEQKKQELALEQARRQAEQAAREEAARQEQARQEQALQQAVEEEARRQEALREQQAKAAREADERARAAREAEAQAARQAEAERQRAQAAAQAATPRPSGPSASDLASRALDQIRSGALQPSPPPAASVAPEPSRPRSFLGSVRGDVGLQMYIESWRNKLERNGNLNFPPLARTRAHDDPVVTVSIRRDGSVEQVMFHRSSGMPELDEAVRNILKLYAPFSAFPPDLARRYDVIEIRRTWSFSDRLRILEDLP